MGEWDGQMKHLMGIAREDFVSWLVEEELLSLTYGLAAMVFEKESEHDWLQRRFAMLEDVIEESWAFQEMIQKGRKEAKRQDLLLLIRRYYPALLQLAQNVCNAIQTLEELQNLFEKVLYAKDEEEVHQLLLSAQK